MNKALLLTTLVLSVACTTDTSLIETNNLKNEKIEKAKAFISKVDFKLSVSPANGQSLRNTFKVKPSDLQLLLDSKQVSKTSQRIVNSIEPVVYKGDTIMYLVNYAKGWRLYSVDKRMPVVLAENYTETGKKANDILSNKSTALWVDDIANQTKYLAQTDEYNDNSESLNTWSVQGKGIMRVPYQPVPGEYIYVGMEEVSRTTVFYPHVTKTLWHGITPFNTYSPVLNSGSTFHAPAGCVAVSSAQYLYFLQDKLGYSFNMPLSGSCTGDIVNGYTQSFTGLSKWQLGNLALTDNTDLYTTAQFNNVALVLGYIGKEVGMNYSSTGSSSNFTKAQAFLNKMGVKGKFVEQKDIDIPNIVINKRNPILFGGSSDTDGHMFLIDGAKYDLVEYEYIWRFLEDTTFYDPDRYGVILRESAGTFKENYAYQCNSGQNNNYWSNGSDADDTYYVITDIQGYNRNRKYFKRED